MAESTGAGGRMRRNIVPRTATQYDSRKVRETRTGSMAGLYQNVFNERVARVMTFQGFGDEGQRSVFRPFAPLDFADPGSLLAPGRLSFDPGNYSHWQQCFMIAKWVGLRDEGCQKVSLCLGTPGDGEWMKRPYRMLYKRIADAKKGKIVNGLSDRFNIQWLGLLEGDSRSGAELSAANETFFVQCAVYKGAVYDQEKKKNVFTDFLEQRDVPMGLKPEDPLPIFTLTKSTGFKLISGHEATSKREAIDSLLDLRRENYDPDSEDASEVFFFGDPVGTFDPEAGTLTGGVFVSLFMPYKGMEVPKYSTWEGEIEEFQGYEAQVTRKYRKPDKEVIDASLGKDEVDQMFNKGAFWHESAPGAGDGLVRLPSVEEECVLVANAFKKLPHLLHYAWADRPEWMTAEVKGILGQRVSVVNPKGRTGDDEDDAVVDDEPAPTAAPRKDRTVAGAAGQRPAAGATRRAAVRPEPEPEPDVDDVLPDDVNAVGYDDGAADLTAADDAELLDEPEPVEAEEPEPEEDVLPEDAEPEPEPAPAPRPAARAAAPATRPATRAAAPAAPAARAAAPAARPAAKSPQAEDDDFFSDDTPAAPPAAAKPAARAAAKPAARVAEDADESEGVAGDPVLSAKAAESDATKKMAAAKAAAARAGNRGSTAAAPPRAATPAAKPAAAPPAKGGTAARRAK